ncbi:MAG: ubiquitin-like protein [Lentisphaerota bacterium]
MKKSVSSVSRLHFSNHWKIFPRVFQSLEKTAAAMLACWLVSAGWAPGMPLYALMPWGTQRTYEVEAGDSIENVKAKVEESDGLSASIQMLYYTNMLLEDGRTLSDYNIQKESTITVHTVVSPHHGPFIGGNLLVVTNKMPLLGNGSDITNVTVGGVAAAGITGQGTNWVAFIAPATGSEGVKDVVIQGGSATTTLSGAYTVNAPGWIYDNAPEGWTEVAGVPGSGQCFMAGVYSNRIYVAGAGATNLFRFDGEHWAEVQGLPVDMRAASLSAFQGYLYAIGGYWGSVGTNVYRFDGTSWLPVAGLPTNRCYGGAATLGAYLYYVAGYDFPLGSSVTNVFRFDGAAWTEVAGLPHNDQLFGMTVFANSIHVAGGNRSSFGASSNVYRFDGASWSEAPSMPERREYLACGTLGSSLYVVGGNPGGTDPTEIVLRFDGSSWSEVSSLPVAQQGMAVASLGNYLYAFGGVYVTNTYRYSPGYAGLSPSSGWVTGGYAVVISGSNLCDGLSADVVSVTICGVPAASMDSISATQIIVTAGLGRAGTGDVVVISTSYGVTAVSNRFVYVSSGDRYEYDNTPEHAYLLPANEFQADRSIHVDGDVDYVLLNTAANHAYQLIMTNISLEIPFIGPASAR